MMSKPPDSIGQDEICPVCNKPKKEHTAEEILLCSRKMLESGSED